MVAFKVCCEGDLENTVHGVTKIALYNPEEKVEIFFSTEGIFDIFMENLYKQMVKENVKKNCGLNLVCNIQSEDEEDDFWSS